VIKNSSVAPDDRAARAHRARARDAEFSFRCSKRSPGDGDLPPYQSDRVLAMRALEKKCVFRADSRQRRSASRSLMQASTSTLSSAPGLSLQGGMSFHLTLTALAMAAHRFRHPARDDALSSIKPVSCLQRLRQPYALDPAVLVIFWSSSSCLHRRLGNRRQGTIKVGAFWSAAITSLSSGVHARYGAVSVDPARQGVSLPLGLDYCRPWRGSPPSVPNMLPGCSRDHHPVSRTSSCT